MIDKRFFNDVTKRIAAVVPAAEEVRGEIRTRIEQVLKQELAKLDVLSREEFEAAGAALQRAEARIAELEARVESLETALESPEG